MEIDVDKQIRELEAKLFELEHRLRQLKLKAYRMQYLDRSDRRELGWTRSAIMKTSNGIQGIRAKIAALQDGTAFVKPWQH